MSHPLFARFYDRVSPAMEREVGAYRDELLGELAGRVVDLGVGNGASLSHYPSTVSEVVAIEPEPYLRARAAEAAGSAPVPVTVIDALADALPLETASPSSTGRSTSTCSPAGSPRSPRSTRACAPGRAPA